MAEPFFEVATPDTAIFDGRHIIDGAQDAAKCKPGRAMKIGADGELELCGAADTPDGLLYGLHGEKYDKLMHSQMAKHTYYEVGKPLNPVTIARGYFQAFLNGECFLNGTLPAQGDKVYARADGLLSASADQAGRYPIGKVERVDSITQEHGTMAVVLVTFELNSRVSQVAST